MTAPNEQWLDEGVARVVAVMEELARELYRRQQWADGLKVVAMARGLCEHFEVDPGEVYLATLKRGEVRT